MGNSFSNQSPADPRNGNTNSNNNSYEMKNYYLQQPLISLTNNVGAVLYSPIARTRCEAVLPPPPPPPLSPQPHSSKEAKAPSLLPPPPPPSTSNDSSKPGSSAAASAPASAVATPEDDAIAKAAALSSRYNNPGPYEHASMDAKRLVTLDTWEGFRCDVSKQMNPYMMVIHSFAMTPSGGGGGSPMGPPPSPPSSYTMVTQVGDENGVLVSRWDSARGSIDGRVQRVLLGGLLMGKLQLSLSNSEHDMFLAEVDVGTNIPACTWTANLKYGSMAGGPAWGGNYWQAITPQLTLGGEGMFIAAQKAAVATYALKYNFQAPLTPQEIEEATITSASSSPAVPQQRPSDVAGASSLCANYHSGHGVLTLNYRRVVTPQRVLVGAEMALPLWDPFIGPPEVVVGTEFNFNRTQLQFALDATTGKVSSVLETKLGMGPAAPRFGLCATVDHYNQDYKFGYQINMEG